MHVPVSFSSTIVASVELILETSEAVIRDASFSFFNCAGFVFLDLALLELAFGLVVLFLVVERRHGSSRQSLLLRQRGTPHRQAEDRPDGERTMEEMPTTRS